MYKPNQSYHYPTRMSSNSHVIDTTLSDQSHPSIRPVTQLSWCQFIATWLAFVFIVFIIPVSIILVCTTSIFYDMDRLANVYRAKAALVGGGDCDFM